MGGFGSIWHWIIVLVIVLLLFGAGKLPRLMGDMAKGVKAFKSGLKDEDEAKADEPPKPIDNQSQAQASAAQVQKDDAAKH